MKNKIKYVEPRDYFPKEIREKYNIIYDGKGCYAVRIIPRDGMAPLFQLMVEDDGGLYSKDICFDIYWTDGLIKQLQDAKKYAEKLQKGSD